MAIAPKPGSAAHRLRRQVDDAEAERFFAGAGTPLPPATLPPHAPPPDQPTGDGDRRQPAMIRFDRALLARVDRAAKHRGISRSAWIQYTLSKVLDDEAPLHERGHGDGAPTA